MLRTLLARARAALIPPPPTVEEAEAFVRRWTALHEGLDGLVRLEAHQAARHDPENPLAPVHDLPTAFAFVLDHYPPHEDPRDRAVALAFAVVVEHVRYTACDPDSGRAPPPAALDGFLDDHSPIAIIGALRASPRSWVRRSVKRLRKEVGDEAHLEGLFVEIVARYGGHWTAPPPRARRGRARNR